MKKAETVFTERVLNDLKSLRYPTAWFKISQRSVSGTPDILGCAYGLFIGLELKTEEGEASRLQLYELKRILDAGGLALVVRPNTWPDDMKLIDYAVSLWRQEKEMVYH